MSYDEPVRPRRASSIIAGIVGLLTGALTRVPRSYNLRIPNEPGYSRVSPKKPLRLVRGICARHPKEPAETRVQTCIDHYGCPYHFGHDGRVRLGVYQQPGRETPVGEDGQPLRGRSRRGALRVVKVRMLESKRNAAKTEAIPA